MRENRTCGSEGGEAQSLPYPYRRDQVPLSLSSFVICVYLCASVVKWCFGLG